MNTFSQPTAAEPAPIRPAFLWDRLAFQIVIAASVTFVVLTIVAMLIYPGGTNANKTTTGYSFFTNFFSDLGRTVAHNGQPNTMASSLFTAAMAAAGGGLALFFIAFSCLFTRSRAQKVLGLIGTAFGVIAGLCFVGVGLVPSNVYGVLHGSFVLWGFSAFLAAVTLYCIVILIAAQYPNRYALIFVAFAVLLAAYLTLMTRGPRGQSAEATLIQVTGQKIIVYASLISVALQSIVAQHTIAHETGHWIQGTD